MTKIAGRSGSWMDGISATCSDGTASEYYGGGGGNPWEESAESGFTGANLRGDAYATNIQLLKSDGTLTSAHGGTGGTQAPNFVCPAGMKLYQMAGGAGGYLDSVQFGCRSVAPPMTSGATVSETTVVSGAPAMPSPLVSTSNLAGTAIEPPQIIDTTTTESKSSMSSRAIIIIIIVVFALLVALATAFFLMRRERRVPEGRARP